jgi:hypothetical protein
MKGKDILPTEKLIICEIEFCGLATINGAHAGA